MSKKRKSRFPQYVNHPRYGDRPIFSGLNVPIEDLLRAHWSLKDQVIFPETAILGDASKQNYSMYPRKYYVDVEKVCVQCSRKFIFFAKEQRYWFEELGFFVDADCIKCVDCRKSDQQVKLLIKRYETLKSKAERTENESSELKNIAHELFQIGYIKNSNKIDGNG